MAVGKCVSCAVQGVSAASEKNNAVVQAFAAFNGVKPVIPMQGGGIPLATKDISPANYLS